MGTGLSGSIGGFALKAWHEMLPGDEVTPCYDAASALSFLRGFMHDPFAMAALRALAVRSLQVSALSTFSDHEVIRQLAWQLEAGHLCLVPLKPARPDTRSGGAGRPAVSDGTEGDESPAQQPRTQEPKPPAQTPPAAPATTPWITFQLIDDDTEAPVAGVGLRLKLPDGTVSTYTTDTDGRVHLANLSAGTCHLEQMVDMEAYEVVQFT